MEKIYRAGIVPFYLDDSEVYMLFMKPSDPKYGGVAFQIAKGKREDNETNEIAALREGFEELGLLEENIIELIDTGSFLGRTNIFLAKVKDKNNFTDYHFETGETRWMTLSEFEQDGRNIHVPIIRKLVKDYVIGLKESESSDKASAMFGVKNSSSSP
jgi:8-oxo-dGTP pyrophosphatase MutT (NUDIX family)